MAKKLARILKTEITADMPLHAMAEAIRAKGRGRDTVLAHITPKEAKKLKQMGGRGSVNPETGLPEFEDGYDFGDAPIYKLTGEAMAPAEVAAQYPEYYPGGETPQAGQATVYSPDAPAYYSYSAASPDYGRAVSANQQTIPVVPRGGAITSEPLPLLDATREPTSALAAGAEMPTLKSELAGGEGAPPGVFAKDGFIDRNKALLAALGLGGAGVFYQRGLQGKAARQAVAQRQQQEQLAAPYRAAGDEALARAQRGELTATGQQALQAAQARLAQGAQQRGGVGAQQQAMEIEKYRQQLLETQRTFGLNMSSIADEIVRGAIKTQLQADQAASQATGQFYAMLGQALGPTALKALG